MNILFDDTFQSAGLENILKQEPIGGSLSIGVKTNIPRLVGTYSDRISRTMIMINTCFVLSLPCKEMIAGKKYQLQ
jgi:hypothetical protein